MHIKDNPVNPVMCMQTQEASTMVECLDGNRFEIDKTTLNFLCIPISDTIG